MKKIQIKYTLVAFATILTVVFVGCSKDDSATNQMNNNAAEIEAVSNIATTGSWRITSYIDSGQDETSDYTGFSFTFNNDGTLTASTGTVTHTGVWSVTDDSNSSSNDDDGGSSSNDIDFNIMFSSPPDFAELTDDWDIVSRSTTKIELIDVSGGNGGTDTLTFERN